MNRDKVVLEADDQFEISYRDHYYNMAKQLKEMTDRLMIPIKFDEYQFELFVKEHSSGYHKMEDKHEKYLRDLEREKNEYC